MRIPLTVEFTIEAGEVWTDPDGVSWYVKATGAGESATDVAFERTEVTTEDARTVVRKWRKMGDEA